MTNLDQAIEFVFYAIIQIIALEKYAIDVKYKQNKKTIRST